MKRIIEKMSIDTTTLIKYLNEKNENGLITYDELNEVIGRNVQGEARGCLMTARHRLLVDEGIVFGVVRGEGIKRLNQEEVVDASDSHIVRSRRLAKRGFDKLTRGITDFTQLPPEKRIKHNVAATLFAAIRHMTKEKSMQKLVPAVEKANGVLPVMKTLEAFKATQTGQSN